MEENQRDDQEQNDNIAVSALMGNLDIVLGCHSFQRIRKLCKLCKRTVGQRNKYKLYYIHISEVVRWMNIRQTESNRYCWNCSNISME